jgi:hypothetical protein
MWSVEGPSAVLKKHIIDLLPPTHSATLLRLHSSCVAGFNLASCLVFSSDRDVA